MSDEHDVLAAARAAYARHDWTAARDLYAAARERAALGPDDLSAMSDAAWWLGSMREMLDIAGESYEAFEQAERQREAGRLALEIGITLMMRGEEAAGSGWMSRAQRLIGDDDCAERGYLTLVQLIAASARGDHAAAATTAREVQVCGARFGDATLTAMGLFGEGLAQVRAGDPAAGMRRIDDAMLSVTGGRVAPAFAGNIYCGMISICTELGDVRRAREWTVATERWCATFPAAVMFLGVCRMHRAQLDVMAGEWDRAEDEARRVCDELAGMNAEAVGEALYQLGEIRRRRGDARGAESAYAEAFVAGRDPQPGSALLQLAAGRTEAARAAITAALAGRTDRIARAALIPAAVTILLATGDRDEPGRLCDEMDRTADIYATAGFEAAARQARGALLLASGDAAAAAVMLRDARGRWLAIGSRYDAAYTAFALADACRAAGDDRSAAAEHEAARSMMDAMGVPPAGPPGGLSEREVEVLRHVAAGATNKQIAAAMFIADKTVARHLSNIFTKLGVGSRTAAAAYAHRHGLAGNGSIDP